MTESKKGWLLGGVASMVRDIATMGGVVVVVGGVAITLSRPYWEPFAELPVKIAQIEAQLQNAAAPQIVDFQGIGFIADDSNAVPGGSITVFYSLRRNATCDTDVRPFFHNYDTNLMVTGPVFEAVKAPVTSGFNPITLTIRLPENLNPGTYSYYPEMTPKRCGVYGPMRVPPTEPFTVRLQ